MSDSEPEHDEQTELVEDESEGHQHAREQARDRRERDRDAQREDAQLDLYTAAATRWLDEFEDDTEEDPEAGE
jgi:hypothetical protein